jgi:hypothetical protein
MFSRVASLEDRRRGFPVEGGTAREGADIVKDDMKTDLPTESLATCVVCCERRSLESGLMKSQNAGILVAFIVYEPGR